MHIRCSVPRNHTARVKHNENEITQWNYQRNNMFNVFEMIYSVVYVNIVESKDQRFVCTPQHCVGVLCLLGYA